MSLPDHLNNLTRINHLQNSKELTEDILNNVSQFLDLMSSQKSKDMVAIDQVKEALSALGSKEQNSFWRINSHLILPIQKLIADTRHGGTVTGLLQQLQNKVSDVQPPKDKRSLKQSFLLLFSARNSALDMWMESYPQKRDEVTNIINQLSSTKKQLKHDNLILANDKAKLDTEVKKLGQIMEFISKLEEKLKEFMEKSGNDLMNEEFLPVLEKRHIEMQQQLLIARQSVMTIDLIIKQNQTLIHGIDQSIKTTASALDIAASVALANRRNHNLKKFSEMQIDVEKLKHAQQFINQTINDIQNLNHSSKEFINDIKAE